MSLRKWRIAMAVDRGSREEAKRLASTPELQRYAQSLEEVDEILRSQGGAAGVGAGVGAPADLSGRIIESVREAQHSRSRIGATGGGARPIFALAAAAGLAGVLTAAIYIVGPSRPVPGAEGIERGASAQGDTRGVLLDPAAAILPAGWTVVERMESPLTNEAELLKRDTQRITEMVISSLPFVSGSR